MAASGPTLDDWLVQRARTHPQRPAVMAGGTCWSYRRLRVETETTARRLQGLGVQAGQRVAVLAENSLATVCLFHALMRLRAVLVPLNTRLTAQETLWQLNDAEAALFLHDGSHEEAATLAAQAAPELRQHTLLELADLEAKNGDLPRTLSLQDLHSIVYTSGTSGRPKGVMLSYGNHWWSAMGSACNLGLMPADRWLVVLPLFHVGGMAILLRSLLYGSTAVVHRRFDPAAVNASPAEEGVTLISLVSTMLRRMLAAKPPPARGALRAILLGGGPAPTALLDQARHLQLPVLTTYGLTEAASQVTTSVPDGPLRVPQGSGRPLLTARVCIGSPDRPLPAGQSGPILVQGPTVMQGYFRRPQATAQAIENGWLHTGDVGCFDKDGCLHVLDRRADLIVSGGENIYPAEVEAVLAQHPAVDQVAVVGVSHEEWGQAVAAAVVWRAAGPVSQEELLQHCRRQLAGYKVPKAIVPLAALPRGASGKVVRQQLRRLIRQHGPWTGRGGGGGS